MKSKKNVSYFPVDASEQDILLRLREGDLSARLADVREILDLVAEAKSSPADVEQALRLLDESRQGEGIEARFDNLEARLAARIARGLEEIEGRLSKHFGGTMTPEPVAPPSQPAPPERASPAAKPPAAVVPSAPVEAVPKDANLAFRIGTDLVSGESAAQFYVAVWRWLFAHGKVRLADLPIGTAGKKRYEVAATAVHPSGKEFYRAEQPIPGAFLEVNLSRGDIVRRAKKYLTQYGAPFDVIVGGEE
jgi:hypothetical protein